jgi:DNA gyrase subunit A
MTVRIPIQDIRSQGRNTMGVRIMRLNEKDKVVSVTKVLKEEETQDNNSQVIDEINEKDK